MAVAGLALVAAPASAAPGTTTTTVTQSAGAQTGAPVTFTATVSHGVSGVPTGTVTFTVTGVDATVFTCDGGNVATLSPKGGTGPSSVATCSFAGGLQASDSNYSVSAVYSGDGTYTTSTGSLSAKINKGSTTTNVMSSSNPSVTGQSVTFNATVGATAPATGTPTGSVTFAINGNGGGSVACDTTGDTVPLVSGAASCTISAGLLAQYSPYSVSAVYSGDANYKTSTGTLSQTVSKAGVTLGIASSLATPVNGQAISFTASVTGVTPPGGGTPGGSIIFTVQGNNVLPSQPGYSNTCDGGNTQPLSGGTATCSFAKGLLSNPITYTVTAKLQDPNYKAATTASLVQQVNKAGTTTALSGLPGSLIASQGFTFTITVQTKTPGGGVPTGNMEWAICKNSSPTCSGLPGGTYIFPKPSKRDIANNEMILKFSVPGGMRPGFYSVNANFSGDSDYQSSSASTGFILVNKVPTSMHIVLQRNPLQQGSNMMIRAAVVANSDASGSLGAPQGDVTFTITGASGDTLTCNTGSNVIPISTVSSNQGRAVCTVPAADISTADSPYEVQTQYSGDSNYDPIAGSQTVYVVN